MILSLKILLIFTLVTIAWSDFHCRTIPIWQMIILFISLLEVSVLQNGLKGVSNFFIFNLGFLAFQLCILTLYFSIRDKSLIFIPDKLLGWGDIILFAILALGFSIGNFILFLVSGYLLSLMIFMVLKIFPPQRDSWRQIPLAGVVSLLYAGIIIVHLFGLVKSPWNEEMIFSFQVK